ncbi:MAG: DUF3089 domain-containing protein [Thermoleophilaceae bacterium]
MRRPGGSLGVVHRTGMVRVLLLTLAALTVSSLAASGADARVVWLCRPGVADNPCRGDQTTRYFASDGSSRVGRPAVPAKPPIDCFYVYPTVSNQPTPNATQTADPEIKSIAKYQAQRFSTRCRVFTPIYREVTAAGVSMASQTHDTTPYETAFTDVREAWLSYLRHDNHGRGVVLIGHSQGSRMLRALIRREIDPKPSVRRLLVSAIIPGANATVRKGSRVGGDFAHVPTCRTGGEIGCVISYSTFNETPPDNARFGRTDTDPVGNALGLPVGPKFEVMCVDPTRLAGAGGRFASLQPSEPFAPGVIAALLVKLYRGPPPTADKPWLQPQDHYTGRCMTSNHARVLMLSPVANARKLDPSPDATWGTHLVDINIALGNLTALVGRESRAYRAVAARRSCLSRRVRIGRRRIGRIALGATRKRLRRRIVPVARTARSYRWCVRGSRRRVAAVFARRSAGGRAWLVVTRIRRYSARRVSPGQSFARLVRRFPAALRLRPGLYRAGPRSRRIFGVRRRRVRFVGVAAKPLLRHPRLLRRYLRLASL